jgi:hypothetical protein
MVSSKNVIALFWVQKGMVGGEHDFHPLLLPQTLTTSTSSDKTINLSSFISMPDRFSLFGFQTKFTYYNYLWSWQ